jgi:hypothetical protein
MPTVYSSYSGMRQREPEAVAEPKPKKYANEKHTRLAELWALGLHGDEIAKRLD